MYIKKRFVPFIVLFIFFLIALRTINDYGINWDSPAHFARGQAYFRYFVTGKTDYKGLPKYCFPGNGCNRKTNSGISEYQSTAVDFEDLKKTDNYGHPPLSDIFEAAGNQIFFIKLGWLDDIPSYHVYVILSTFLLSVVVAIFTQKTFGTFAATIAGLCVYLFPLLAGEQHFNVKDPPMAAFFTTAIFFFWLGITKKRSLYIVISAIAGGISFATKFNFLFAPFIIFPWLVLVVKSSLQRKDWALFDKKLLIAIFLYPVIILGILYLTWPALWDDPVKNFLHVVSFYTDLGTHGYYGDYIALKYFFTTFPLVTLFFFFVGVVFAIRKFREHNYVTILWLSFFLITIIRVSLPRTAIYGGLRQIMELIAPVAMIAGIGALYTRDFIAQLLRKQFPTLRATFVHGFTSVCILAAFLPIALKLIALHPNENVYFNPIIGGLKGAAEKNMYGYGGTFGNGYNQGIQWLNTHAEKQPKLALLWGQGSNLSHGTLREDVDFLNTYTSGYNQLGEYQLVALEQGSPVYPTFRFRFPNEFLDPVYTLEVEGVPLLRIWKNDPRYVKKGLSLNNELKEVTVNTYGEYGEIIMKLNGVVRLKRMEMKFSDVKKCKASLVGASVHISTNGVDYIKMPDAVNDFTGSEVGNYPADFTYLFVGDQASHIMIIPPRDYPCKLSDQQFTIYSFTPEM